MLRDFWLPEQRVRSLGLLATAALLGGGALAVGIDDNPPGIFLMMLAAMALVFAVVHPWQEPRRFVQLSIAALAGFVAGAVLSNVFEYLATLAVGPALASVFGVIGGAFFLLAVVICPAALVVGLIGAVVTRSRVHVAPGK